MPKSDLGWHVCRTKFARKILKILKSSGKIRENISVGCTPKGAYGNTAFWEGSGKGSGEGVLRRVLRRGPVVGFTVKKGSEKGSQKGFWKGSFQKVPSTPPWGVRPLRRAPYHKSKNNPENRRRANREVQTVNWDGGGEGAVKRGVKSGLKKGA